MRKSIITGMGGITPLGNDLETITKNLKEEHSNIRPFKSSCEKIKTTSISTCKINLKEEASEIPKSVFNGTLAMSYVAIKKALEDAGYTPEVFKDERVALISGMGATGIDGLHSLLGYKDKRVSPFALIKTIPTAVTGPLVSQFGIKGPVHTIQHACASGVRMITQAMDLITLNKADMVVCVVAEYMCPEIIAGFDGMKALYRGDDIELASVPFSKNRSGFTMSEGSTCIIVCSEDYHSKHGLDKVYAECVTYADFSDGGDITNPNGDGAKRCLEAVQKDLTDLHLYPDLISAHATSTPNGDVVEADAIFSVYQDDVPVVALKRLTGHSITASAAQELMFSLIMMRDGFIVSSPVVEDDPEIAPIYLAHQQLHIPINVLVKTAFGFGGLNSVIGLKRYVQ